MLGCRTDFIDYSLRGKSAPTRLYKWEIDLKSGTVQEGVVLSDQLVEFPTINPNCLGRKTR